MHNGITEERVAQARAEISKRIAPVCGALPEPEFESLLDRMTSIHCKYEILPPVPELAEWPSCQVTGPIEVTDG
jgi:hypothetical protein